MADERKNEPKSGKNVEKSPRFGEFWIAEMSFFEGNPLNRYIIHIDGVLKDSIVFTPFLIDSCERCYSKSMNQFTPIKRIKMDG